MEYTFYDFLALLGSLALFLYGMKIMSEGLQKFAGDRLRSILIRDDHESGNRRINRGVNNRLDSVLFCNHGNGGEFC